MLPVFIAMVDSDRGKTLFESIYHQYRKQMFFEARKILQDDYLAEDAVQDALLRIARLVDGVQFRGRSAVRVYVLLAARRAAMDIREKEQRISDCTREMDLILPKTVPDKNNDIINRELLQALFLVIRKMPENLQTVLFYSVAYEMTGAEIARLLGRPVNTVNKWLRRAREKLKDYCVEEGISLEL